MTNLFQPIRTFLRPLAGSPPVQVAVVLGLLSAPAAVVGQDEADIGRMITIEGTVDTAVEKRVTQAARAAQRDGAKILIFDLQVNTSDFGPCWELARDISTIGGTVERTVAYISRSLSGHGLLIALACDEIVVAPDVQLGDDILRGVPPTEVELAAYRDIARGKGHSTLLARAFLDERLRFFEVTTPNGKRFLSEEDLEEFGKDQRITERKVIKEQGQPFSVDANTARRYGLAKRVLDSRRAVAEAYGLPEGVAAEAVQVESNHPILLKLSGKLDDRLFEYVQRRLKEASDRDPRPDILFLEVDSASGDYAAASNIAQAIRAFPARKVAWVPRRATGPSVLLVFAADELVMGKGAEIGEFAPPGLSKEEAKRQADAVVDLARGSTFPLALVRGFVDPSVEVFRVRSVDNPAVTALKTTEDLDAPDNRGKWDNRSPVKAAGTVLKLDAEKATNLDFAVRLVDSREELRQFYDVGEQIPVLEPGWVDRLVEILSSPGGTFFLVFVGALCLYIELQIPGFGLAGLTSALCFVLFFWSRFLSGTARELEIIMFVMGLVFLAVEAFVLPGFGIAGITGILLLMSSLVLASQSFSLPRTEAESWELLTNLSMLVASLVVFLVAAATLARFLPSIPFISRMMLDPAPRVETQSSRFAEEEIEPDLLALVGQTGTTITPLRPAGRVRVDERLIDVVTEGEFIPAGTDVEIVEVRTTRVVVRATQLKLG